jgi:hypothetical protein
LRRFLRQLQTLEAHHQGLVVLDRRVVAEEVEAEAVGWAILTKRSNREAAKVSNDSQEATHVSILEGAGEHGGRSAQTGRRLPHELHVAVRHADVVILQRA